MTRCDSTRPRQRGGLFQPGQAYYDRAVLETVVDGRLVVSAAAQKGWFEPAVADFKKATERDGRFEQAWDMLGLTHETTGELDQAISEYSQEMALNRLGRSRVANAYCLRGDSDQKEKKYDAAIADYEKAIVLGATGDDWSCDPYNPLFGLYTEDRRYDQAWETVNQARKFGKWIAPELLDRLKKGIRAEQVASRRCIRVHHVHFRFVWVSSFPNT